MVPSPQPFLHRGIHPPKLKAAVFALVGMNSWSTTFFFYYLYFYTQARFGFGELNNFWLAALMGLVYGGGALLGGQFAQKFGYLFSAKVGFAVMIGAILAASQVQGAPFLIALAAVTALGMCFTWPALEAAATEGEPPGRLQSMVGLYNVTWAVAGALAYFTGGAMLQQWGLKSLFFCPASFIGLQFLLAHWLEKEAARLPPAREVNRPVLQPMGDAAGVSVGPKTFLKMAWLANPFAYLTVNTIIATIPSLAKHRGLSPMIAGFICSLWLFARAAAFLLLRLWPKWHYRFDFLAGAYGALILAFATILLARSLWIMSLAQIVLGLALGLIYYSSLFYSMDLGDTKGEHGGIHEAVIGFGNGAGPAVAALALTLLPSHRASGAIAVSGLLLAGLAGLLWIRFGNCQNGNRK